LGRSVLVLVQGRLARSLLVLPDPPLGLVGATIIAVTEMLSEGKVAALDHRHFSVVSSAHTAALTPAMPLHELTAVTRNTKDFGSWGGPLSRPAFQPLGVRAAPGVTGSLRAKR
jgi:hypothetical protein